MSTFSGKSKVLVLPSQGFSYAKWGCWVDGFASCLPLKGLHVFAALDTTMPTEYPEVNEDEDDKESLELVNVLTLQLGNCQHVQRRAYSTMENRQQVRVRPPSRLRPARCCTKPRRTTFRLSGS